MRLSMVAAFLSLGLGALGTPGCDDSNPTVARDARTSEDRAADSETPGLDVARDSPGANGESTVSPPADGAPKDISGKKDQGRDIPPAKDNDRCTNAETISLATGTATINGSTSGLSDEFANVTCGVSYKLDGPQAYYKVTMSSGRTYRIALTPSFSSGYVYVFSSAATCQASGIQADCASKGATGASTTSISAGDTKEIYFQPSSTETYYLAVDSESQSGAFKLEVEDFVVAANSTCSQPMPIALTAGKATVKGSTAFVSDELPKLKCGSSLALAGPQVYYSLQVSAGKSYKISLSPVFIAHLYIFPRTVGCTEAAISAACGSKGTTGDYLGSIWSGKTETLTFKPGTPDTYLIAVDSSSATTSGSFDLVIEES